MSEPTIQQILDDPAKYPKQLLKLFQEIDSTPDHKLTAAEMAKWISKHADELTVKLTDGYTNVEDLNIGRDLKTLGPSAIAASKPYNNDDYFYKEDTKDGLHKKGDLNKELLEARDQGEKNGQRLEGEFAIVADKIRAALMENTEIKNAIDGPPKGPPRVKTAQEIEDEKEDAKDDADDKASQEARLKLLKMVNPKAAKDLTDPSKAPKNPGEEASPDPAVQKVLDEKPKELEALKKDHPDQYKTMIAGMASEISNTRKLLEEYKQEHVVAPIMDDFKQLIIPTKETPKTEIKR